MSLGFAFHCRIEFPAGESVMCPWEEGVGFGVQRRESLGRIPPKRSELAFRLWVCAALGRF